MMPKIDSIQEHREELLFARPVGDAESSVMLTVERKLRVSSLTRL